MASSEATLRDEEKAILEKLGEAWDDFMKLDVLHEWHQPEFMTAIHAAAGDT